MASGQTEYGPKPVYTEHLTSEQRAIPYPFLRESDVTWSTTLWKTIDLNELFNQFIYFPDDDLKRSGKENLGMIIWQAIVDDKIKVYEDDELLIPIDNQWLVSYYTKPDTIRLEIGYYDSEEEEEYETIIRPKDFPTTQIYSYNIKEVWFVGKQDTRQDSRRIALAPVTEVTIDLGGEIGEKSLGKAPAFWIPMQNPDVRNLLAKKTAYFDANNLTRQPSWDYIFVNQVYSAYTTRESNCQNRSISQYMTGEDALYEAAAIEERILELENDMWEY